ncbi:ABC transporter substrate-binding protein [Candidatus Thioglobus sp.]|jgi:ABC-type nitrate/sulfonate/bicarbonate transport system substrate-binding protein/signal transduction histidine kinase|uniref:ABC transporter substrate-binding protein n=1 Tax=Candidatus Thioglobus sp. TaxID=2026721 RepID=UPI001D8B0FBA|nr:ABC transporter substrate-binding protein [Candidatus Thioglobus sp.]MBT3276813.1 ABC transporter substrate-binding protein [Candidatus Thioglobus sp.]MBT3446830.1 ABC transporter substrate-binding protein [Candidatus Thioglobus sp.]MBT4421672.1 ABC transporter substrate-binding protein [Candidatus Thioglobus sp.]MBT6022229.1 ABC transporter substrate-binding protein [Candidatus Thioglobus sp.]MBT6278695.1 ABC transporter substrate-binding protein [Candidatus Thioglobus sp.]
MQRLIKQALSLVLLISLHALAGHAEYIDHVKLALQWKHQFQFAGYYMAKEKGFYQAQNIEVEISEVNLEHTPTELLLKGKVEFATSGIEALKLRSEDEPLVSLYAISRNSPLVLLVKKSSNIKTAADLRNKRISMAQADQFIISSMLKRAGLSTQDYIHQAPDFSMDDLINDRTDAVAAYQSNEGFWLKKQGIEYRYISPDDYGLGIYSDLLVTTEKELEQHPIRVSKFRQASLEGWKYAFSHVDETIDVILKKYNTQNKSREHLQFEAREMAKLVQPLKVEMGSMRQEFWQQILRTFTQSGYISKSVNLRDFVYEDAATEKKLVLTPSQKKWLLEHPSIRLGVDPGFYPIEYKDNRGEYLGISADVVKLLSQQLGVSMQPVSGISWSEVINQAQSNTLDVLPAIAKTKARQQYLLYSKPYMQNNMVIVTTKNHPMIRTKSMVNGRMVYSLESLHGKKVAVTKDYPAYQRLADQKDPIELLVKPTTLASLQAVISGEANAAVVFLDAATALLNSHQMTQLRIDDNAFKEPSHIYFAVRKDWPELVEIINMALDVVGPSEINRIQRKWRATPVVLGVQKKEVALYLGILMTVIIFIVLWLYFLKKAKTKIELQNKANISRLISQSRHVVMGEMIAILTHQWKQPLTAMMLSVGTVKTKLRSMKISATDAQFLNTQMEKTETMMSDQNQLLADFRDFFHPDKQKELFAVCANINSVLEVLQGLIVRHHIKINTSIPPGLEIVGYARELRHVMINLIQNSIDQIAETKVSNPTISIHTTAHKNSLDIVLEDNAGGIDKSIIETIFEPYVSTKSLNGTGLGLYMSKKIIQDNFQGDIRVVNTRYGAKFTIKIPLEGGHNHG